MPVWRCPHGPTPQAEASRCWVCRRSTTSCVTCRHYRRGISGGLGLCGLDPRRDPVADTDVRACWVGAASWTTDGSNPDAEVGARQPASERADGDGSARAARAPRTVVPVESLAAVRGGAPVALLERPRADGASPEPLVAVIEAPPAITDLPAGTPRPVAPVPAAAEISIDAVPVMATTPAVAPRRIPGRWWLWGDPDPWPERL